MILHPNNEVMLLASEINVDIAQQLSNYGVLDMQNVIDVLCIKIAELQYDNRTLFGVVKEIQDKI